MGEYSQSLLAFLSCWDELSLRKEEMPLSADSTVSRLSWKVDSVEAGLTLHTVHPFFSGWEFFKKSLCQLEHSSSEMKIVAICADQSRRNRRLAQQQGFWSLVTWTRGSQFSVCAYRSAEETWEALGFALLREV